MSFFDLETLFKDLILLSLITLGVIVMNITLVFYSCLLVGVFNINFFRCNYNLVTLLDLPF